MFFFEENDCLPLEEKGEGIKPVSFLLTVVKAQKSKADVKKKLKINCFIVSSSPSYNKSSGIRFRQLNLREIEDKKVARLEESVIF